MKTDARGKVVELRSRQHLIPRNLSGDPSFTILGCEAGLGMIPEGSILHVFTNEEVVAMVNRYLYDAEYRTTWQRQRQRRISENLAPIKAELRKRFNVSYMNATEEQLKTVTEYLAQQAGEQP